MHEGLLDALAEWTEETLKDMMLPLNNEYETTETERPIKAYKQAMPDAGEAEERVPYVLLQCMNGSDGLKNGRLVAKIYVRWVIAVYNTSPAEGNLSLMNIIGRIRDRLLSEGTIGRRYRLASDEDDTFSWEINTAPTWPYYVANIYTLFDAPPVERKPKALFDPNFI